LLFKESVGVYTLYSLLPCFHPNHVISSQIRLIMAGTRESLESVIRSIAGTSYSVTGGVDKSRMPEKLPAVTDELPTYKGGEELLAYCMWQIRLTTDREVVVRALASAVSFLIRSPANLTGSSSPSIALTGFKDVADPTTDAATAVTTNFEYASGITVGQWRETVNMDIMEKAYYFGVLCHAMCKTPTAGDPMQAFNEKRVGAATRSNIGDPKIFLPGSVWLSYEVIRKVHASFNAYGACRAHLIHAVVQKLDSLTSGECAMFSSAFTLLENFGVTNLAIIKDAIIRYPSIMRIPHIEQEIRSAAAGLRAVSAIDDERLRPYAKAMYMDRLVFVQPADIKNLLGICREYLKPTHETYKRYKGGFVTESQRRFIANDIEGGLVDDDEPAPAAAQVVAQPAVPAGGN